MPDADNTLIEQKLTVTADDWTVAIKFLDEHLDLSKSKLKDAMNKGAIWLKRGKQRSRLRRARATIQTGDVIEVFYDEQLLTPMPRELQLVEDMQYYSIWNKPVGMLSEGSDWGDYNAVARHVEIMCHNEREVHLVNRLEQDASGLIVVAHNRRLAADWAKLLNEGQVQERYRIDVSGELPESGEIDTALDERPAHTRYQRIKYSDHSQTSKADAWVVSGNECQLRRHMAGIGNPVVGDSQYNDTESGREGMQLRLVALEFTCPVKGKKRHIDLYAK